LPAVLNAAPHRGYADATASALGAPRSGICTGVDRCAAARTAGRRYVGACLPRGAVRGEIDVTAPPWPSSVLTPRACRPQCDLERFDSGVTARCGEAVRTR